MASDRGYTMTVNEAAKELDVEPRLVRDFVRNHNVETKRVLGHGRTLYIVIPDYIEKLREGKYLDEAQKLEEWLRARQGDTSGN